MTRFSVILLALIFWGLPAAAEEKIVVLSGQHEGYIRLVLPISSTRDWALLSNGTNARLIISGEKVLFDTSKIFSRIAKTTLSSTRTSYSPGESEFHMALACPCSVSAFSYLDAYVVIDISDPTDSAANSTTATIRGRTAPTLEMATRTDEYLTSPKWVVDTTPKGLTPPADIFEVAFPKNEFLQYANIMEVAFLPDTAPEQPIMVPEILVPQQSADSDGNLIAEIDVARNRLIEQLAIAAEQGLLDFSAPIPKVVDHEPSVETLQIEEVVSEGILDESIVLEDVSNEDQPQFSVSSIYDRDAIATQEQAVENSAHCIQEGNLDIASWGTGMDFPEEISVIRKHMLFEFDEPDMEKVEQLIRLYIRYGFGVEALSYLDAYGQGLDSYDILLGMARVLKGLELNNQPREIFDISCGGNEGIWALAYLHKVEGPKIENEASIIDAFSKLPSDIRKLLGPKLADSFLARNMEQASQAVIQLVERAPGSHDSAHLLSIANQSQTLGNASLAKGIYREIAEANTISSESALIELADMMLNEGDVSSDQILTDLGTVANQNRGNHVGDTARRLELLWMVKRGDAEKAIQIARRELLLDTANQDYNSSLAKALLLEIDPNNILGTSYAEIIHQNTDLIGDTAEDDNLRGKISSELLNIGLPNSALDILQPLLNRATQSGLLLAAEAYLLEFKPEKTLRLLEGVDGEDARILRIRGMLDLGKFTDALSELEGHIKIDVPEHWYGGDWSTAANTDNAARKIRDTYVFPTFQSPETILENVGAQRISLGDLQEMLTVSVESSQSLLAELNEP